jgi:UDP:flavonoid glycosyltransferase YjiC (YdhE family)
VKPVIYAAISGPKIERTVLATLLKEALGPLSSKYDVTLSRGDPEGNPKPYLSNGIRVFDWIPNQDDYIIASDVIIGRAGHGTIMKSLVYGKPMLLIPIPDHTEQHGNAKRAESLRVARILAQKELNSQMLDSSLQELLSKETQENAMRISQSASPLRGIQFACDLIENMATR